MIPVAVNELTRARVVSGDRDVVVTSLVADSRRATPGSLFVAFRGTRTDGHAFLEDARRRGARAALCERGRGRAVDGVTVLEAEVQLDALAELARIVRSRSAARVVGIVGSAGKTTTKDILHALTGPHARVIANETSYNNELGVPLTLSRLERDTEVAICELGTGAIGEVAALCGIARPTVGVVTCLGPEHLAAFATIENVARAEAELIEGVPPGAPVVLPVNERLLDPYRREDLSEIRFGFERPADVRPLRWRAESRATDVELAVGETRVRFQTNLRARHHCLDLCAAAAAYAALGLPLEGIGEGATEITLSPWRGEEHRLAGGAILVNDAYNANPCSMAAALGAIVRRRAGGRVVAVLGDMAELGPDAPSWHRRIGEVAADEGIDVLVAVGSLARHYCTGAGGRLDAQWFADREAAAIALPDLIEPSDVVLVKGSRSAGLERLAVGLRYSCSSRSAAELMQ